MIPISEEQTEKQRIAHELCESGHVQHYHQALELADFFLEQTAALRQQVNVLTKQQEIDHESLAGLTMENEVLKTELKHMTQWKNIKDETATVFMHQVKRLQGENEALMKEGDELRKYLIKFGTHSQTCPRMMAHPLCTCGYDDLVKEK